MFSSFEKRHDPPYWFGIIPEPAVLTGFGAFLLFGLGLIQTDIEKQILQLAASLACAYFTLDIMIGYKDWVLRRAKKKGKERASLMTFSKNNKKVISDELTFKTFIDENILLNNDGSVSLAFSWQGIDERNLSFDELQNEHKRRVMLLHSLQAETGIAIEHHFLRHNDSSLIDQYVNHHNAVLKKHKIKPIIHDVKMDLANLYRPLVRANRVITVLSLGKAHRFGFIDSVLPNLAKLNKKQVSFATQLKDQFTSIKDDYENAQLFIKDDYKDFILNVINPYSDTHGIDWRYEISSQILNNKPVTHGKILEMDGVFYGTVLLQNYPEMLYKWSNLYCETNCTIHTCQYIQPIDAFIAVDKSAAKDEDEQRTTRGIKGQYRLGAKLRDSKNFKKYVTHTRNSVHRNFFVITFMSQNEQDVLHFSRLFEKRINKDRGRARTDIDLQMAMFYSRLPSQGRNSPFMRSQDHADTLSLMMPFTTFKTGSKVPESLRLSSSGSPVLYAPSTLEVPHELNIAQMGGGKDTQYGLTIAETYHDIRYDILELGTSYRGIIEAVGGHYCKAREQVINPLATYDDFTNASQQIGNTGRDLSRDFINMQTVIVQPIFSDLLSKEFTTPQEIVMNKSLRLLYENPQSVISAPTLPHLLDAIEDIETDEQRHKEAKEFLGNHLSDFLETETGQAFKEQDQFEISPIANAIDFDKFDGKLFDFFLTFTCTRLITNAMSTTTRNQILLNEYGVFVEKAPAVMRTVTLTIDRMGRKELCGLSRNTQDFEDITSLGTGAVNAIPNKTLLSRVDKHAEIGSILKIPESIIHSWELFLSPEVMDTKGYRQAIVCQRDEWYQLHLEFPSLLLDLMNTKGADKAIREKVYNKVSNPYERIKLFRELKSKRDKLNETPIL